MMGGVLERNNDATYRQRIFNQNRDFDQSTYDVYATGPFTLLGREHELVVGASKRQLKTEATGGTVFVDVRTSTASTRAGWPDRTCRTSTPSTTRSIRKASTSPRAGTWPTR
ncbi:hypothetical protein NWF32_29070 [Pseudomonas qingdaonensis]|nr:hypothetical protein [Pseudomonas qingdaonensis]